MSIGTSNFSKNQTQNSFVRMHRNTTNNRAPPHHSHRQRLQHGNNALELHSGYGGYTSSGNSAGYGSGTNSGGFDGNANHRGGFRGYGNFGRGNGQRGYNYGDLSNDGGHWDQNVVEMDDGLAADGLPIDVDERDMRKGGV